MSIISVKSLDEVKRRGPGTYSVPYTYNGKKFSFIINIGKNLDNNGTITLNGYGGAGCNTGVESQMEKYINQKIKTGNNNSINLVMRYFHSRSAYEVDGWQSAANSFIKEVSSTFNVSTDHASLSGFSFSAEKTAKYAASFAKSTGAKDFSAVIIESSLIKDTVLSESDRKALINNNVTLFNVYQNKGRSLFNHVRNIEGVHVIDVEIDDHYGPDSHMLPYNLMMNSGIMSLSNGGFDFTKLPTQFNSNGKMCNISYKFVEHYLDKNGKYVTRTLSAEEVQKIVEEIYTSNINTLYEKNKNLSDFAKNFEVGGPGDTLASNLAFVSNSMDGLKGKITSHSDINYTKSSDNEAGVVGAMYAATNYYGSVTNVLYGNLSAEADAVYAIANAIYQMDGMASVIAEGSLTDGIRNMFDTSNPTVASNLENLKRTTSELVDTAKNAVMANGRYDELSNLLTGSITAGNVGKISITSLESAVNAVVPSLNDEVSKAQGLKASVDDFMSGIGASSILQGGVWNDVKTNMETYQNLLDCNMKAADFISDTIKTAMGVVVDYINGSSDAISAVAGTDYGSFVTTGELDDSKLPEIKTTLEEIQTQIDKLKATISEMETAKEEQCTTTKNDDGVENRSCVWVDKYSASDIQPYKDSLTKYESAQTALNAYVTRLEGLAPLVQNAQKMINDAISQVKTMYENPVTDAQGNQSFSADLKLDMSAYGFEKDGSYYKNLINDYYDKLNTKTPTEQTPTVNPEAGSPDNDSDDDDGKRYSGGGGYSGGGSSTPDPSLQSISEAGTEGSTIILEIITEIETEAEVEGGEVIPEVTTEANNVVTTEAAQTPTSNEEQHNETKPSNNSNRKPKSPNVESPTTPVEFKPEETEIYPEEIPEEYSYDEEFITQPEIIEIQEPEPIVEETPVDDKKGLKTMGVAAGVGLALGATALGAHTIVKNKDDEDDDSDYGYDK